MSDKDICPECHEMVEVHHGRFAQHGSCPGWFVNVKLIDQVTERLESRFTEPSQLCPHPERWHSRDADSTEIEVSALVGAFARALRPDFVLETGTAWGQTAEQIGEGLQTGDTGYLFTLEVNPERVAESQTRCNGLPVSVVRSESLAWTPPDDVVFGLCWFDSLHHLRVPEFMRYREWMKKGTIVGFHDTAPHQGQLRAEIMELESAGLILPIFLNTPRGAVFAEVT